MTDEWRGEVGEGLGVDKGEENNQPLGIENATGIYVYEASQSDRNSKVGRLS